MPTPLSRRDLLRLSALAAGASYLPSSVWAKDEAESDLLVRTETPFNAEPSLAKLVAADRTPIERFYVRNHGPVPKIDEAAYRLRVEGLVNKPLTLSLDDIRQHKPHTVAVTLTCAGNRRQEMAAEKPIPGVQWDAGAIGHATWTGVALADILAAAELKPGAKHVWFEGLDPIREKDGSEAPFGGSIPIERALATLGNAPGALLAWDMNGKPLTPNHGFPLRMIVPGYIGARSVKWLAKIVVSDKPSPNHYVAEAYKIITTDSKEELATAEPIYEFPINSAICTPAAGSKLSAGKVKIAGYALPPGDPNVTIGKVELSTNGGRTWTTAKIDPTHPHRPFCWHLWQAELDLPTGQHTLVCRATDSRGRVQPETCDWNLKGYLHNAWHQVTVEVV